MTREEGIAKMAQLRTEVDKLVEDYNATDKVDVARDLDKKMTEKVNEYTGIARTLCFAECKATGDPMLEAVKRLNYKTIAIKDEHKGEGEADVIVRKVEDRYKNIDLLKLDKYCGGIGADEKWSHIAMKLNFLLTAQKCEDLGIDPKSINDSYAMSDIARAFDMGKHPTSKTNILKTLQTVITAMLGDGYKASSHDVNFLMTVFARKGRAALSVTCANHSHMRAYLAEVCHRIVTNGSYNVDYKRVSGAVTTAKPAEKKAA